MTVVLKPQLMSLPRCMSVASESMLSMLSTPVSLTITMCQLGAAVHPRRGALTPARLGGTTLAYTQTACVQGIG